MKVSTHGFEVLTHRDKGQNFKNNDQVSTPKLKVSTDENRV